MLLLRTERLPEGPNWLYELKLEAKERNELFENMG